MTETYLTYKARPLGRLAAILGRQYVTHQPCMRLPDVPGGKRLIYKQLLAIFIAGEGNHNFVRSYDCIECPRLTDLLYW